MNPIRKLIGEAEDFSEYEELLALDAEQEKTLFDREPLVLTPHAAYQEALALGKGNVPKEIEELIATSSRYSLKYAQNVLDGPFRLGERAIAKSGLQSHLYATYVLGRRFPLGEPSIKRHPLVLAQYKRFFKIK